MAESTKRGEEGKEHPFSVCYCCVIVHDCSTSHTEHQSKQTEVERKKKKAENEMNEGERKGEKKETKGEKKDEH